MALREVIDADGETWLVFEAHAEKAGGASTRGGKEVERWLCIYTDTERRRILPIPERWEQLSDAALLDLVRHAEPRPRILPSTPAYDRRRTGVEAEAAPAAAGQPTMAASKGN